MLPAALGRNIRDSAFEHLEQRLLNAFATDVAGDRDVLTGLAYLVDLVDVDYALLSRLKVVVRRLEQFQQDVLDILANITRFGESCCVAYGQRNVDRLRQRAGEQCLAAPGRADKQQVGFVYLNLVVIQIT